MGALIGNDAGHFSWIWILKCCVFRFFSFLCVFFISFCARAKGCLGIWLEEGISHPEPVPAKVRGRNIDDRFGFDTVNETNTFYASFKRKGLYGRSFGDLGFVYLFVGLSWG